MKGLILIIVIILSVFSLNAQQDSIFKQNAHYPIKAKEILIDNLQNLYVITADDQLKKYNSDGDSLAVYNQSSRYGKLFSIDISNPLKILLFYQDYSTIVVVDRFLSQRFVIDLKKVNIYQPASAGLSFDNNLWVFDAIEQKLKKIDDQGNLLLETVDLRGFISDVVNPIKIIDKNNLVHLYDPKQGIYIFDQFGSYQKKIPVTELENVLIIKDYFIGTKNNLLHFYNKRTHVEKKIPLPDSGKGFKRNFVSDMNLIRVLDESFYIYSFQVD